MKMFLDDKGNFSSARVAMFLIILAGLFIACFQVVKLVEVDHVLVFELLGMGLGLKLGSKFQENRAK